MVAIGKRTFAVVLAVLTLGAAPGQLRNLAGTSFDAKVSSIIDGDTLDLIPDGEKRAIRVRLEGIDAPEAGEPFSGQARSFVRVLLFEQRVRVNGRDVDRYGRLVARVTAAGRDASVELVHAGLACHFAAFSSDAVLASAQSRARTARTGFWAAAHKPRCAGETTTGSPRETARALTSTATQYHGNASSHLYHAPGCPNYNCRNCTRVFASEAEAKAAGFRAAGDCLKR